VNFGIVFVWIYWNIR